MHNEPNSRLPGEGQPAAEANEAQAPQSVARRRALLKGLGKGGAALAAVAPIQSFAVPKLNDGRVCSLSGLQSGVTSHTPSSATVCQGWPPAHFVAVSKFQEAFDWPAGVGGVDAAATLTFADIFRGSDTRFVIDILRGRPPVMSGDDEKRYWIAAYFNAWITSNNFAYSPGAVISQYQNTAKAGDYLNFYMTYMSQRTI